MNRQDLRRKLYAEVNSFKTYDEARSFMVGLLEEAGCDTRAALKGLRGEYSV